MSKRIRHTGWVGAMAFAIAALTVFIGSAPAHAQEPEENGSQGSFAPYPGDGTDGLESDVDDLQDTVGGSCTYQTRGDNPHRSGNDVSVHGWWKISPASGQCPTHADVEVWLQGWWCNEWYGCWWRTIDSDEKRVRPGGGSGRRTNIRELCATFETTGYRNVVDLVGVGDPGDKEYVIANVNCRPGWG